MKEGIWRVEWEIGEVQEMGWGIGNRGRGLKGEKERGTGMGMVGYGRSWQGEKLTFVGSSSSRSSPESLSMKSSMFIFLAEVLSPVVFSLAWSPSGLANVRLRKLRFFLAAVASFSVSKSCASRAIAYLAWSSLLI